MEGGSGSLTIRQGSDRGIINWQDFSIAPGEITKFLQPSPQSATLNRVVGSTASNLLGALQANGQVFLINPNGILIGAGARIDTGSFVASTLDVADSEFLAGGDMKFFGSSAAAVTNLGTINASSGDVFLLGREVTNAGTVTAANGVVGLGVGTEVLLKAAGDERLFVSPGGAGKVSNSGTIAAAQAELKANGGNAYALAVNNTGTIRATGTATKNGRVLLTASGGGVQNSGTISARNVSGSGGYVRLDSGRGGKTVNSGTIDASGKAAGQTGGRVEALGDSVELTAGSLIDVAGEAGGGVALVGGDEHGANPAAPNARNTQVAAGATINADAIRTGTGGRVIVWADETTQFAGGISARGGSVSGDGGFAEVSGKLRLEYTGLADLRAANGRVGSLLLDPTDIYIVDSDTPTPNTLQIGTNFQDVSNGASEIQNTTLQNALAMGNVSISTASAGSGGFGGQILFQAPVMSTSGNSLTLFADSNIRFNSVLNIDGDLIGTAGALISGSGAGSVQASTISLTANSGGIDLIGPVVTSRLDLSATNSILLTNPSNIVGQLRNVTSGGAFRFMDSHPGLTITGTVLGGNAAMSEVLIQSKGNLTLAAGGSVSSQGTNNVTLVTTAITPGVDGYFINNSAFGTFAVSAPSGRFLIYSDNERMPPAGLFQPGGLDGVAAIYNSAPVTYPNDPLGNVNVFYFANLGAVVAPPAGGTGGTGGAVGGGSTGSFSAVGTLGGVAGGGSGSGSVTPPPASAADDDERRKTELSVAFVLLIQGLFGNQTVLDGTEAAYNYGDEPAKSGGFTKASRIEAFGIFQDLWNGISGLANSVWNGLSYAGKVAVNAVSGVFNGMGNAAKSTIAKFINSATNNGKGWIAMPATKYNNVPTNQWVAKGQNVKFVTSGGKTITAPAGGGFVSGGNGKVYMADANGRAVPIGSHWEGWFPRKLVNDYYLPTSQGAITASGQAQFRLPPSGGFAVGGGRLIGQDGAGLIGQDGAGLIGQDGAGLIGQDGAGLIGQDGAGLIGQDGAGIGFFR